MSRLARPQTVVPTPAERPFSNFGFVERHFSGSPPIRRLFSLARSRDFRTVVLEDVPPQGAVADEVCELQRLFPDYVLCDLKRVSFWRTRLADRAAVAAASATDCLGWAILKHDRASSSGIVVDAWHVFESVMVKYDHPHNCVPFAPSVPVLIGDRVEPISLKGWLYCQQNRLNKCCAHVALRTLATAFLGDFELPFSRINSLIPAPEAGPSTDWLPRDGLSPVQIEAVLAGLGIPFDPIFYPNRPEGENARLTRPYQKVLYSGIEAGVGAILGFSLDGPRAQGGHVIPVFGHTFNEDNWAARGEGAYFRLGEKIRYIPSDAWLSSFLIHDDNFGSDLCLPKRYVDNRYVDYVVALRPKGFAYGGAVAEVLASLFFSSIAPRLKDFSSDWLERLNQSVSRQELILRTLPITKDRYLEHLRSQRDWGNHMESSDSIDDIARLLHDQMWMVEVSIPDLFSTNLRKLGELLLCGQRPLGSEVEYEHLLLARFPGLYVVFAGTDSNGDPRFNIAKSELESHTRLLVFGDASPPVDS